jgi:Flp pilus assembly protein TadG
MIVQVDPKLRPGRALVQLRPAATALEFAVVLPVLLTFVLGCVDFGRFAHSYIVVTNAARVGAGFGTVNPYTPETFSLWQAGVQQAVVQEMAGFNQFNEQALTVATTVIPGTAQRWSVQVSVSYPFQTVVPWPGIPSSLNLCQTVVMQTIRP